MILTAEEIVEQFVAENHQDYVGLWEVCIVARFELHAEDEKLQAAVLNLARLMLNRGFLAVDLADGGKCIPWRDQNFSNVLERIRNEWNELGQVPNIGDICWFDLSSNSERQIVGTTQHS